jgi:predicted Zn-dependent protease
MTKTLRLALLVLCAAGCGKNPETGRRQLLLVSEAHEKELGVSSYQRTLAEQRISSDPRELEPLRRVGARISAAAAKPDFKWEFNVIVSDHTLNAWCLPGGKIAFYSGIYPVLHDEAGMAFVMGHEVAHALLHHSAERMSDQMVAQGIAALVQASVHEANPRHEAIVMAAFGMATQYGVLLPYSRKHEAEADRVGLELMAKAGYDPHAAVDVWKRMAALNSSQPPVWLSTHPSHESRIADMEARLPEAMALFEKSARAPAAKLERIADRSSHQAASFAEGSVSVTAVAGAPLRESHEDGRRTLRLEFSFDRDVHLTRVEITGPGVRDVVETKAGVPANHPKHLTLVRRDAAKPDFPPGEYRTTFEGTAGGQPFKATCTHHSP